jgi:hypothetical protein
MFTFRSGTNKFLVRTDNAGWCCCILDTSLFLAYRGKCLFFGRADPLILFLPPRKLAAFGFGIGSESFDSAVGYLEGPPSAPNCKEFNMLL